MSSNQLSQGAIATLCCICVAAARPPTACERAVHRTLNQWAPGPTPQDAYIPMCDQRGQFSPLQFDAGVDNFWCVDLNGREIPGSRTRSGQSPPNCQEFLSVYTFMYMYVSMLFCPSKGFSYSLYLIGSCVCRNVSKNEESNSCRQISLKFSRSRKIRISLEIINLFVMCLKFNKIGCEIWLYVLLKVSENKLFVTVMYSASSATATGSNEWLEISTWL